MPFLADDDPIVLLATKINEQIPEDTDTGTIVAALSASLGAYIDMAGDDLGGVPPDFAVLREMLMRLTSMIVSARSVLAVTRES